MNYILKNFDNNLISFSFSSTPYEGTVLEIINIYKEYRAFFPLNLELDSVSLLGWIKRRTIPKNREFVHKILMELDLNLDNIKGIVDISKSLSLNDCYWIVEEGFQGKFEDYNLYDNDFNKTLALLAYTGYGSVNKIGFMSTPEFTTNGMLAKAWRRDPLKRKGIFLYKSGSQGFANSGKEPYSEFYAYQIAKKMGLNITPYSLGKWKGKMNSICELFSSKEYSFIPIYYLVTKGGWKAVLNYYQELGDDFYEALIETILLDVIIINTDRHFGNFGLLIDNKTNSILKPAPIFDNGLSLFYDTMDDDLDNIDKYANAKIMKNAGDFISFIRPLITSREKKKIRKLINFKFEKHSTYNLSAKRLKIIEGFIQRRVKKLLEDKNE
jgi:hypothetical protein